MSTLPKQTLAVPVANGSGASQAWGGGWASVFCYGTFDSGTVTVQVSPDSGTTWLTAQDSLGGELVFTANGHHPMAAYGGQPLFRATLTGSSGATSVALELHYGAALVF